MNILFWFALIFIITCVPAILLILGFYYFSTKFHFDFKVVGYLKFRNIEFFYENEKFQITLKIDHFQIYLIWLRFRISFNGVVFNYNLKNESLSYLKSRPVNKADFVDTFVLQRKTGHNNGDFYNEQPEYLKDVKNQFFKIIQDRYISKHTIKNNENGAEEEIIDNLIKKVEVSKKDNFLRNLITFFDILIENVEVNFKLTESDTYHSLTLRKLILGVVKGINKHKEIHFICISYDLRIKEYLINPQNKYNENLIYNEFILLNNQKVFINLKLEYGFSPKSFYSMLNTINLRCEVTKTKLELSTRSIKSVFKIIKQLIKLSKINEKNTRNERTYKQDEYFNEKSNRRTSIEIQLSPELLVECVEEVILEKISSQMKKMKIKINDMEVKIVSDNHQYIFTHLNFTNFNFQSKNDINYYCDSNKVKLLKSWAEIKIQDLILSSYKKQKVILDLQSYTLNLSEDIVYYHQSKEANIRSTVNSEAPSMEIVLNTKELDKIIELIICIVVGLEKIEAQAERNIYIHKYIEKYSLQSLLNLNFEKVNLSVYDDTIQTDFNNISLNVRVEEEKFVGQKVDIIFHPVSCCIFAKNSTKYCSNIMVKGFRLNIVDNFKISKIDIVFDEVKLIAYDNHLIDVLKFVADFLNYCLKAGAKKTYKKKTHAPVDYKSKYTNIIPSNMPTKKKEFCTLVFKKVLVYNYVDFEDLVTIKVKDYHFHIDEWMNIPKVKIYHQSLTNGFLKKRTEFINVERFYIKFNPETNETQIDFGYVELNVYCFELVHLIIKLFTYHSFFPVWVNYHMAYKHNQDEDYRKIYVADFAKKDKNFIKFGNVVVKMNQHCISSCGILQTNPLLMAKELEEKSTSEVNYLKSLKSDQITIHVKNFTLNTAGFKEKESTNENVLFEYDDMETVRNISYYKKITKRNFLFILVGELNIVFETVDIFQENSKLVELKTFKMQINDEFIYDNFELEKLNSIACSYKMHNIFYKELNSRKTKNSKLEMLIENLKFNLEDIKIIDKISLFYLNCVKSILAFPFKEYALTEIMDNQKSEISSCLDLHLKNFELIVTSIDPITNLIYNRLHLKMDLLSLSTEETPKTNKLELSVFYITFGFDCTQNFDYPLIIIPLIELYIDHTNNTIKINCPDRKIKKIKNNKKSDNPLVTNDGSFNSELDKFIIETKGFTLFLNFNYLNTFYKIFENFWKRSAFVKKYLFGQPNNSNKSNIHKSQEISIRNSNLNQNNQTKNKLKESYNSNGLLGNITPINISKITHDNLEFSTCIDNRLKEDDTLKINLSDVANPPFKLLLTLFDFKIIYLLQIKDEHNTILKFHPEVKEKGYFGYIIRFYQISLKYLNDTLNAKRDELKLDSNLFTVSFLHPENFDDDKFFIWDKEVKFSRFYNLKLQKNFNEFMELNGNNRYKLINKNFLKFFYYDDEETNNNQFNYSLVNYNTNKTTNKFNTSVSKLSTSLIKKQINTENDFVDLIFDYKHTLFKISDISFKRDTISLKKIEEIYIAVNDLKITWNKFNMDIFTVLLFNDVLLIVDKIILKIDNGTDNKKEDELPLISVVDLGRFNFVFDLNNPQICIQNEIKNSKVLLTTKSKCSAKISKICVNENSKELKLDFIISNMALYISPNYMDKSYIYWLGESDENIYYLEEKLFNKMLETPKIQFLIYENIRNNELTQKADLYTNTTIAVDKIAAEFGNIHFHHFLNIIEVFIFDRGYSYAEEKQNIDSRAKDMEMFRLEEIKNRIKMNTSSFISNKKVKQKEISFTLKDVLITMLKENKEIIKLMMRNFEGEHIIYTDKSSETSINVKNLKILDLFKNKNETILTPNFEIQNIGDLENKIDLVTFRKKDSYISIGTESNWYVLDYYEINILPLLINTSKYHCDFIIEFFFNNADTEKTETEYKNILLGGEKSVDKNDAKNDNKNDGKNDKEKEDKLQKAKTTNEANTTKSEKPKEKNITEVSYPIYIKHIRINETQLFISFFLAENSPFNLRNAKLKFSAFEKKDKFYPYEILLNRFIGHLKFISFTNASNILASLFNWGGSTNPNMKKKKKNDEQAQRKMLLGKQFDK